MISIIIISETGRGNDFTVYSLANTYHHIDCGVDRRVVKLYGGSKIYVHQLSTNGIFLLGYTYLLFVDNSRELKNSLTLRCSNDLIAYVMHIIELENIQRVGRQMSKLQ